MLEQDLILVADDSSATRRIVCDILRRSLNCHNILEADNGTAAQRLITEYSSRLDWIFCDWEMPGLTGSELIRSVRANSETMHIPFIMVTSRADRESLLEAIEAGVDGYVIKPFTANTLIEKVQRVLHRAERRKIQRIHPNEVIAVQVTAGGNAQSEGQLVDLSLTGIRLRIEHGFSRTLAIFEKLEVCLQTEGLKINIGELVLPGEIVRIEADSQAPEVRDTVMLALALQQLDRQRGNHLQALLRYFTE